MNRKGCVIEANQIGLFDLLILVNEQPVKTISNISFQQAVKFMEEELREGKP